MGGAPEREVLPGPVAGDGQGLAEIVRARPVHRAVCSPAARAWACGMREFVAATLVALLRPAFATACVHRGAALERLYEVVMLESGPLTGRALAQSRSGFTRAHRAPIGTSQPVAACARSGRESIPGPKTSLLGAIRAARDMATSIEPTRTLRLEELDGISPEGDMVRRPSVAVHQTPRRALSRANIRLIESRAATAM